MPYIKTDKAPPPCKEEGPLHSETLCLAPAAGGFDNAVATVVVRPPEWPPGRVALLKWRPWRAVVAGFLDRGGMWLALGQLVLLYPDRPTEEAFDRFQVLA